MLILINNELAHKDMWFFYYSTGYVVTLTMSLPRRAPKKDHKTQVYLMPLFPDGDAWMNPDRV